MPAPTPTPTESVPRKIRLSRARSSVGERSLHTREVAGSKPAVPILGCCRCGNGKAAAQPWVGAEVEARGQHPAAIDLPVSLDLPTAGGGEQAVHRQAGAVALDPQVGQIEVHLAAGDLEPAPPQPVGRGVGERGSPSSSPTRRTWSAPHAAQATPRRGGAASSRPSGLGAKIASIPPSASLSRVSAEKPSS